MPQVMRIPKLRGTKRLSLLIATSLVIAAAGGCSRTTVGIGSSSVRGAGPEQAEPREGILVRAGQVWTASGYQVRSGQSVTVTATGEIAVFRARRADNETPAEVGPEGTYLFGDDAADREFPLPAGGQGPAPCYGLIARIADGPVFFIGAAHSFVADRGGELFLGVNDYDVSDNEGQFVAEVLLDAAPRPVRHERVFTGSEGAGQPAQDCSVVVFYVDGLRPDVVREMSALGHLPHITRHFLDQGTWLSHAFTAFPSDTITSNGTMWTGCFSDRHGLKGQVSFSRRRLDSDSFLEPFGPQRSAQWLSPSGVDKLVQQTEATAVGLVQGEAGREAWLSTRHSSVPPLYEHLQRYGKNWAAGVLPVMTEVPPPLWSRSLARKMPYLQTQRAWEYMDDANADYAVRNLLERREAVTIIWLPETDTCSHKCSRGQFGMTRRTIAKADQLLGTLVDELQAQGRLDKTYLLLVSDHGHVGGRDTHLSHFDLASDFFFRPRVIDAEGRWTGGGLGLSVRMHRYQNWHPEDSAKEFVFIDGDGDGVARVYLPKGEYRSRDWSGPNRPDDLMQYRPDQGREPLDLPRSIASIRAVDGRGRVSMPIDLVLMKLTDERILITTADRGQAVIERRAAANSRWEYRYVVVDGVTPAAPGEVSYREVSTPSADPLHLTGRYSPLLLSSWHDERTWLELTAETEYPDAVVTLSRHMLWDEALRACEPEFAPDLVVTARGGWYFGTSASPGTMHGYPLAEAARASWFVSGPGVRRRARVSTPCRLADLTPTMLDMLGLWEDITAEGAGGSPLSDKTSFDGRPLRELFAGTHEYVAAAQPLYRENLDLAAWQALDYVPLRASQLLPRSINNPAHALDLHNIVYGVASLGDQNVFRVLDDVVSPLSGGRRPLTGLADRSDAFFRHRSHQVVAQGVRVPDVSGVALADYSLTSQGNLQRANRAIDWVQQCTQTFDGRIAAPLRRESLPLTAPLNDTVDAVQTGFWELYHFGQRSAIRIVDEMLLSGVERNTDRALNGFRRIPNEVHETAGRAQLDLAR